MSTTVLPDPQLMADANSLSIFTSAFSQAAGKLINGLLDGSLTPSSPEYAELKAYFKENTPKLKVIVDRLEADLA